MELYYKDLISEDASVERLVEDLMLVVQGVEAVAKAAGVDLEPEHRQEIASRLGRLKQACARLQHQAVASARAADKVVRQHPYSAIGFAFAAGLLAATLACRRRHPVLEMPGRF